jgi:signal transduction histidine kinase
MSEVAANRAGYSGSMASQTDPAPGPDRRRTELITWTVVVAPVVLLSLLTLASGGRTGRAVEIPTILLVVLPLLVRSDWPVPSLLVVAFGSILTSGDFDFPWVQVLAVILAAFEVGQRVADRMRSLAVVIAVAAVMTVGFLVQDANPVEATVLPFVFLVPSWLAGDTIRTRRLDAIRRAEAAERALRERDERLAAAAAEERRHVARELHDVIAHGVSVMVIQAGAARQVVRSSPDAAEESLLAVEATGREAMAELRRFLGALGDDAADGGLAPQPGIGAISSLVDRVREAGLPVSLEVDGEPDAGPVGIPATVDVTVYRIVQEALTNALRYAGRATTIVRLAWESDRLRVEVLDDGPGSAANGTEGAGRGLAGMRDRVELAGGHVEAGPRLGGGYGVRAWLPLDRHTMPGPGAGSNPV